MKYPFLISFSGMDGSGKTQLIVLLRRFLRRQGIHYLYIHNVKDSFADRIAKIFCFKATTEFEAIKSDEKISLFSLYLRMFILFLDALYLRIRLLYFGKNYEVIIFDRYIFDKLIQIAYLRKQKHPNLNSWLLNFFPRPNMPLYLHITPEQALERKKEVELEGQDLEYFQTKYFLFEEGKMAWKLINIDNSSLSLSEAKKKIISLLKKRYYRWNKKS